MKKPKDESPKLSAVLDALPEIKKKVFADGWQQSSMGRSYRIDYNCRFDLYIRKRPLKDLVKPKQLNISKMFSSEMQESARESLAFPMVSNPTMGDPLGDLTPCLKSVICEPSKLPSLSSFDKYPSLLAARRGKPALVIAFDSEWFYEGESNERRQLLTWQFACVAGDKLCEFIFVRKLDGFSLSLEVALARILDSLPIDPVDVAKIRRYTSLGEVDPKTEKRCDVWYNTRNEALVNSKALYQDKKKVHARLDWSLVDTIPVVLLCHTGKVDVSALEYGNKRNINILLYCAEVQGGLISLQPTPIHPYSLNPKYNQYGSYWPHAYPVSLQIADTMCHAPAGMKRLKDLGSVVGWDKVDLEEGVVSAMDLLLQKNPRKFFEYASNDSVVTLLYAAALYGYNRKLPVTVTSATAYVMRSIMMSYLKCSSSREFDRKYRGLQTVGHGLVPRKERPGYVESTSKEPISDKANTIQYYASQAYHGGYNGCFEIGYYPFDTFDYDLQNAYPTAMCLVSDVDWENPIRSEIQNRALTLQDFTIPVIGGFNPLSMMVGYIRFSFPPEVKYPCIPVNVDGIPIYPMTSEGIDGAYACGPEIYLALRLGAEVFCERGFFINSLVDPDTGELSYSLRAAVKQLVADRNRAKAEHGKKSIEELILKTMVCSGYGKNAQDVIRKDTWSAIDDSMKDLGPSAITNPVSACMITSIVRAELLAVQNQCHDSGYLVCSVTTDGFISDIPESHLKSLDLYGIRHFMEAVRLFLTDNGSNEIWEIKHRQNDLVNFTTRGNVSLLPEGVCAHNSCKSGYKPDSPEDRFWLMKAVVSRTGTVDYTDSEWTSFKELVSGKEFVARDVTRHIRMDFDMKRKPDRESFEPRFVCLDGVSYEVATFSTFPFSNIAEFREYRQRKATVACLRTMADWEMFWFKTDLRSTKAKPRDMDWSILYSCVIGHRAGFWKIPKLDELSGESRCAWINSHNTSKKKFKVNDWKNASRNSRQANLLPRDFIQEKLDELMLG